MNRDTLEILSVNNAAVAHYGYAREEFLRLSLHDIVVQPIDTALKGIASSGEADVVEGPRLP